MKRYMFLMVGMFVLVNTIHAEGLTNKRFLKYSPQQQNWRLHGDFEMLGHTVFLHDEEKVQCVWNWLLGNR